MSKLAVAAASIFLIYMTSASFLIRLVYYERLWYAIGRAGKNGHNSPSIVREAGAAHSSFGGTLSLRTDNLRSKFSVGQAAVLGSKAAMRLFLQVPAPFKGLRRNYALHRLPG